MKNRIVMAIALLALMSTGCVTLSYTGTMEQGHWNPRVDKDEIARGMSLKELEEVIGAELYPVDASAGIFEAHYQDTNAWTGRTWFYRFTDYVLQLGAVTFLIEREIQKASDRHAIALFDDEGGLTAFRSSKNFDRAMSVSGHVGELPPPPGRSNQIAERLFGSDRD